jgi:23S rRNA (uridine2552-2'-O)-methyltransferase
MPNPRRPDKYQQQARAEGYEARSIYKLREIDDKLRVIPKKGGILDLGCAPGSWSRFARERGGPGVKIVGIDLQPVENYVGEAIEGSILEVPASRFLELLGGRARLVMSDMAPSTNGNKSSDHLRQIEAAEPLGVAPHLQPAGGLEVEQGALGGLALAQLGPVGGEVGAANQAAPLLHQAQQGRSHWPPVEAGLPLAGDASEGGGQLRLAEGFTGLKAPQSDQRRTWAAALRGCHRTR